MNSLPDQAQSGPTQQQPIPQQTPQPPVAPTGYSGGIGSKELETGYSAHASEVPHLAEVGKDIELPKEVASVGVSVTQTRVPVPPQLTVQGVKPAGDNVSVGTGSTVSLPLTDDQIAQGLREDVTSSVRWLAEWCVRKFKQILMRGKTAHTAAGQY